MRPLIVLVLVIAALAAFYFAFQAGSGDDGADPALPTMTQPGALTPDDDGGPVALVADTSTDSRDLAPTETRLEAPPVVASGDDFDNRLSGMVVNQTNEPVDDAEVILTRIGQTTFHFADQAQDRSADLKTKTGKTGKFAFKNVKPFNGYALKVRHPDYGPIEVGQVRVGASGEYSEPTIVLSPGTLVTGVVLDTGGSIVADAKVYLSLTALGVDFESPDTLMTMSGDDGRYVFENVGQGNYQLTIIADGYGRLTVQQVNVASEDIEKDVTLQVAMMIAGRVLESGRPDPVEGALVQAFSMTNRAEQTRSQTRTNESGEFIIEDVPSGSYTLMVVADGFKSERMQRVETGEMSVLVELIPQPRIEGKVVDAATGQPIRRYSVRLREQVQNLQTTVPIGKVVPGLKDKEGRFVIFAPKPGTYVVEANSDEYAGCYSDPFTISDTSTVVPGVVVNMTKGGSISGRVVDADGQPVVRAIVTSRDNEWTDDEFMRALGDMYPTQATTREMRTGNDGTFTLSGLTPTTYQIEVAHGSFSKAARKNISVNEGKDTATPDVVLSRGATIRGTVYDPAGQPLPGAVVTMNSDALANEFPMSYSTKTGSDGRYEIVHVRGGGYSIKARRTAEAGSSPFQHWEDMKATERKLSVSDDQEYNGEDFRLGATGDR